jgi:general secretion pathway protein G
LGEGGPELAYCSKAIQGLFGTVFDKLLLASELFIPRWPDSQPIEFFTRKRFALMRAVVPQLLAWIVAACASLNLLGLLLNVTWLARKDSEVGYFTYDLESLGGVPYWVLATVLLIGANGIATIRIHYNRTNKLREENGDGPSMLLLGANMVVIPLLILLFIFLFSSSQSNQREVAAEQSQRETTNKNMEEIARALDTYKQDMGAYPAYEEGLKALLQAPEGATDAWKGPYIKGDSLPRDGWGLEFQYSSRNKEEERFNDIVSLGPDGELNTADDMFKAIE